MCESGVARVVAYDAPSSGIMSGGVNAAARAAELLDPCSCVGVSECGPAYGLARYWAHWRAAVGGGTSNRGALPRVNCSGRSFDFGRASRRDA